MTWLNRQHQPQFSTTELQLLVSLSTYLCSIHSTCLHSLICQSLFVAADLLFDFRIQSNIDIEWNALQYNNKTCMYNQQQACAFRSHLDVGLNVFRGNATLSCSLASFNFDSISFSISWKCAARFAAFNGKCACDFRRKQVFSKLAMNFKRHKQQHMRRVQVNDFPKSIYWVNLRLNAATN